MKTIHLINLIAVFITTILYITILYFLFGLLAQAVLGALQILFTIIIYFNFNKLTKEIKKLLLTYSGLALITLVVLYFEYHSGNNLFTPLMISSFLLALFHMYITHRISKLESLKRN